MSNSRSDGNGNNNGWIGYTLRKNYGYMEFLKTGTCQSIHPIAED
ncbi:hypothetical protein [Duncaniella muris]